MMAKLEKELLGQEQGRIDGAIGALRLDEHQKHDWVPAWQKTASGGAQHGCEDGGQFASGYP
jgi:hypothetical protein